MWWFAVQIKSVVIWLYFFFFFNDTATTEIYTRSIVGSVRCVQETAIICYGLRTDFKTQGFEGSIRILLLAHSIEAVSYTHLRAHETSLHLVCRLLLEKKKKKKQTHKYNFYFLILSNLLYNNSYMNTYNQ
eukprot:TRINITY_DN17171_c0_g1_i6.p2 TRINITY_DN17171_c0_g1~~TRINITY_DN17171_c0_g1_i6.p2  ORF type:complete len:131 (+),score=32.77 TRINITY_DN17171_c0_g1_i6:66-458(+)